MTRSTALLRGRSLEYSEYCPLQVRNSVATVAASPDVDISALTDRIDVMSVEHPLGMYPSHTTLSSYGRISSLSLMAIMAMLGIVTSIG